MTVVDELLELISKWQKKIAEYQSGKYGSNATTYGASSTLEICIRQVAEVIKHTVREDSWDSFSANAPVTDAMKRDAAKQAPVLGMTPMGEVVTDDSAEIALMLREADERERQGTAQPKQEAAAPASGVTEIPPRSLPTTHVPDEVMKYCDVRRAYHAGWNECVDYIEREAAERAQQKAAQPKQE